MAISWAEGLLAGAAGVADYSNQEQKRRQTRIDRTHELKNRARMEEAKSKYAMRVNEYKDNQKTLKALEGVRPESLAEQLALHRNLGYSETAAFAAATAAVKNKDFLKRPAAMKLPDFNMPEITQGRADSPLYNWAFGYSNEGKSEAETKAPIEPEATTPAPAPESGVATEAVSQPPEEELNNPVSEEATALEAEAATLETEGTGISAADQATIDAMKEKIKPDYHVTTVDGSYKDQNGKWLGVVDLNDPDLKERRVFIGSGESAIKRIGTVTRTNPDGSEVIYQQFIDPKDSKVYLDTESKFQSKGPKPTDPVEMISESDLSAYMKPSTDKVPGGQFDADFPITEQEKWKKLDPEHGDWWMDGDTPKGFARAIGGAFKNFKKQAHDAGRVTNAHFTGENQDYDKLVQLWKAQAYVQVLGVDGVVEAVQKGAISPSAFFGPAVNKLKVSSTIKSRLAELSTDPTNKFTLPDNIIDGYQTHLLQQQEQNQNPKVEASKTEAPPKPTVETSPPQPSYERETASVTNEADQISKHEGGNVSTVYEDSSKEKHLTAGVGHKLTEAEKKKYPKGSKIPKEVRDAWFATDLKEAKEDARILLLGTEAPEEVEDIITNMAFNMGRGRTKGFKGMFKAIKARDYQRAADEMQFVDPDSKPRVPTDWYKDTGNRAKALIKRMRNIGRK